MVALVTDRGGEMSRSLDVKQLLVDDLQVLSAPLTRTEHERERDSRFNQLQMHFNTLFSCIVFV